MLRQEARKQFMAHKIIAVYGNSGSYKTTTALSLARYMAANSDWFKVLTDTFVGQVVNSIVAIVVIVTVILAYKYTQPIQYKR